MQNSWAQAGEVPAMQPTRRGVRFSIPQWRTFQRSRRLVGALKDATVSLPNREDWCILVPKGETAINAGGGPSAISFPAIKITIEKTPR